MTTYTAYCMKLSQLGWVHLGSYSERVKSGGFIIYDQFVNQGIDGERVWEVSRTLGCREHFQSHICAPELAKKQAAQWKAILNR